MSDADWLGFSARRRADAYWFTDGLPEMVSGLALTVLGCVWVFAWNPALPPRARLGIFALSLAIMAALILFDRQVLEFLKARLTYRRTGYVCAPDANTRLKSILVLMFGRIVCGWINHEWAVPATLLGCALVLYGMNRKHERSYRLWTVLLLPVLGLPTLLLAVPLDRQKWLVFVIGGVWLFAQGTSTLAGYLRENPRPASHAGMPT
jgi:hypothetical protein